MAYREKPNLYGTSTAEDRRQRRYMLWLVPVVVIAPNLGRFIHALGFKASYPLVVGATLLMAAGCVVGGIISYRNARAQAARDLADLTRINP